MTKIKKAATEFEYRSKNTNDKIKMDLQSQFKEQNQDEERKAKTKLIPHQQIAASERKVFEISPLNTQLP